MTKPKPDQPRYTFRIPRDIALKHVKAKRKAEADAGYIIITWSQWFNEDPRVQEEEK